MRNSNETCFFEAYSNQACGNRRLRWTDEFDLNLFFQEVRVVHFKRLRFLYVGEIWTIVEQSTETVAESNIEVSWLGDVDVLNGHTKCGQLSNQNCAVVAVLDRDQCIVCQ